MLAQYLDLAEELNAGYNPITGEYEVVIDVSNYDYCLIQPIGDEILHYSTIDSGAVQSVTDGSAITAINFTPVASLKLVDGVTYNTGVKSGEINRLGVVGRYIKIKKGTSPFPLTKLLVMLTKIS